MPAEPRLFTIPSTAPFLDTLVDRLLDGSMVPDFAPGRDPLALADATIYLPTRRAARSIREAFQRAFGGHVALLPRIRPLGGVDESELVLHASADLEPLPPAMSDMERRIAMTRLILAWATKVRREILKLKPGETIAIPASPADAAWLAGDLLSLMDQIETEEADWSAIQSLVPDDYAEYWQITLEFLKIATEIWPAYLAENGCMDPNARRSALIRREAARLAANPPKGPVIVAGSTGSVPATADLIKVVAHLEQGAVILPGLDRAMDEAVWRALTDVTDPVPSHPQYGLKRLLMHLDADRGQVVDLTGPASSDLADREMIAAEALRPAETTDAWREFLKEPVIERAPQAFAEVSLIVARNEAEEALALALALREAVHEGRQAALVTPDRMLARRVAGELRRWDLAVDDSAGQPLDRSPPATLARLATAAALDGLEPVTLLALLKHPLCRLSLPAASIRNATRALERAILRGPRARHGTRGLTEALDAAEAEAAVATRLPRWRRLSEAEWSEARDLCRRLAGALRPLEELFEGRGLVPVEILAERTIACLKALAADETGSDIALFSGEAGEALAGALTGIVEAGTAGLAIPAADWSPVFDALISGVPVHTRAPADPRIHIWGPLEARLHWPDVLLLAGLNEGTWPATTRNDPWLNRPMKHEVGLEPPERRIGLAAHDFAQGLGARRVVLSRAARSGSAPTVASRWLQRVLTLAGNQTAKAMEVRGVRFLDWARALDAASGPVRPAARPWPKPPVEARPRKVSVTAVETWIRDPYALFARDILKLDPVDPLGGVPGAAERGTLIHDVLADFIDEWRRLFDQAALDRLLELGRERFAPLAAFPEIHALWWPRFERIAGWFVLEFEAGRSGIAARHPEVAGRVEIVGPAGPFFLTGRADRIDLAEDGSLVLLDYKTGTPPSAKEVASLFAPQLPLEAAMAVRGGFKDIPADTPVSEIAYIRLSGGTEPGQYKSAQSKDVDLADLAEDSFERLTGLIGAYDRPETGYLSRARPKFEGRMDGDYDHLARVREWSVGEEGES
ncbi:DNA helicase/exodeoxyribonuclease V subunit B [Breoghania corrubedonensis]|uniref:DNA helicase/exodeoxyribonuclease V subunit B n=1 Tax=Breoghania corrubedonensis TaxID=665038 RepID=A0A2T5VG69_9HYPH|nr:double-strand break repair protein AddB [Breoghania corrubedonensis]PTW62753.1 DNA helicase/exodeoxyribonuclease V subunit B [Breoghania corrubedonensis]